MSTPWNDASEPPYDAPQFGRRYREWLCDSLLDGLSERRLAPDDTLALMAGWYVRHWWQVVRWEGDDGDWTIDWDAVTTLAPSAHRFAYARQHADRYEAEARDAQRFPTLDAWLAALDAGQLTSPGLPEPHYAGLLSTDAWCAASTARQRRIRRWERRQRARERAAPRGRVSRADDDGKLAA